jgi:hypothetical protein
MAIEPDGDIRHTLGHALRFQRFDRWLEEVRREGRAATYSEIW